MFGKILLAVDGSESALRAARVAADLVRALKSERLRIVVAYDHIPSYLGQPNLDLAIQARLQEAEGILQKALGEVGKVPAEIHTEMIEGSPAEAIIKVAKTWNSDLVVMGTRGISGTTELVLGSTSHKVVSHAPCPVLIVRSRGRPQERPLRARQGSDMPATTTLADPESPLEGLPFRGHPKPLRPPPTTP